MDTGQHNPESLGGIAREVAYMIVTAASDGDEETRQY